MKFVRFLYGDVLSKSRLCKEVRCSFRRGNDDFFKDIVRYVTMGSEATNFLASLGAKHIWQVDSEPLLRITGGHDYWHKLHLYHAAVQKYGEILYTDFDVVARPGMKLDARKIKRVVQSHKGLGRVFQAAVVGYHSRKFFWRPRHSTGAGFGLISARKGFMANLVYLASERLAERFLEYYEELKLSSRRREIDDETVLTYSIDQMFGVMNLGQIAHNFEPQIIWNKLSALSPLGVTKQHPVFIHE